MNFKPGKSLKVNEKELCELGDAHATTAFMVDWYGNGGRDLLYSVYPNMFGEGIFLYLERREERPPQPVYRSPVHLAELTGYNAIPLPAGRKFHILVYGEPTRKKEREGDPGWLKLYRNQGSATSPEFGNRPERIPVNGVSLREAFPGADNLSFTPVTANGATDLLIACLYNYYTHYWPDGRGITAFLEYPDFGPGRSYNEDGSWKGKEDITRIYLLRNQGTNERPLFGKPEFVYEYESLEGHSDAVLLDADQDGELELVIRKDVDRMYYLKLGAGRAQGKPVEMSCSPLSRGYFQTSLHACDLDGDGRDEILVTGNPGVVFYIDHTNGEWQEQPPLLRRGGDVRVETLSVPCLADMDGDGDLDLVVGDSSGYLWYFENQAEEAYGFDFKAGIRLKAGGHEIHHLAGVSGSIQGPIEARWGYMNPLVVDWDGDGRLDIINNDIKGEYSWYKNVGSREKPEFHKAVPLLLKGKAFRGAWRSRPAAWRDGLIALNFDGFLQLYHRDSDDPRVVHEGELLRYKDGGLIRGCGPGGLWGRSVFFACDWDMDGIVDLVGGTNWIIMELINAHFPKAASMFWLRNAGTVKDPVFERGRMITMKDGTVIDLGSHKCSPWCVDMDGDGKPDVVSGTEDGKVYVWLRRDLKWDWEPGERGFRNYDRAIGML